jgi:hypothetical protein
MGEVTRLAATPKDSASLTKSGLTRSEATIRPSKRSRWSRRTLP